MTQEEIEKAAVDSCVFERDIFNPELNPYYEQGFKDGAKWRINSVWHNASEIPEESDRYILIESISYDGIRCYNVICARNYDKHPFNERWAYIDDLIPGKEYLK